jgi:hypothetical protein
MGLIKLLNPLLKAGPAPKLSVADAPANEGKAWTTDPIAFMESLTHREKPSSLSYGQLRQMAYRCDVISAVIHTRVNQVASFCAPQPDKHSFGFGIGLRDNKQHGSKGSDKVALELTQFIQHGGIPGYGRDNFETFLRKFTRDSMIYDQACVEIIPRQNGLPAVFEAVDASTIRIAAQPKPEMDNLGLKKIVPYGTEFQRAQAMAAEILKIKRGKEEIPAAYVQLLEGTVKATFAEDELYFGIRNPRTDIEIGGYGMSELETLVSVVTSYLWAEEYNRKIFSQGSIPKGILNLKGEITETQLAAFRREWTNLVAGVQNSWKTPVINAEDIEYVNLQGSNKDMEYMQWIQFLLRIACAIYLIDPAEINFDMPRGLDQSNPMIETSGEAKLRASRDRGLAPLLRFVSRSINEAIIWKLDPDFEFQFLGLDSKSAQETVDEGIKTVQSYMTLNEVRAKDDLPPIDQGDIPMNPVYIQLLEMQQQAEQQEQMAELATKNPDAALVMQGIDPKAERMKAEAEAAATEHNAKADAHATRRESHAKADAIRMKAKEKPAKSKNKKSAKSKVKKGITPFDELKKTLM